MIWSNMKFFFWSCFLQCPCVLTLGEWVCVNWFNIWSSSTTSVCLPVWTTGENRLSSIFSVRDSFIIVIIIIYVTSSSSGCASTWTTSTNTSPVLWWLKTPTTSPQRSEIKDCWRQCVCVKVPNPWSVLLLPATGPRIPVTPVRCWTHRCRDTSFLMEKFGCRWTSEAVFFFNMEGQGNPESTLTAKLIYLQKYVKDKK